MQIEELKKVKSEKKVAFNHLPRKSKRNFLPVTVPESQVTLEMWEKEEDWYNSNSDLFH